MMHASSMHAHAQCMPAMTAYHGHSVPVADGVARTLACRLHPRAPVNMGRQGA